jgi:predicted ester cyclase
MGIEENKGVVRRYFLGFDDEFHKQVQKAEDQDAERARLTKIHRSKYVSPEVVIHSTRGIQYFEGSTQEMIVWINAMPDLTFQIEDMIAAEDKVITRYSAYGTFTNDYGPYPTTGKEFKFIDGITISKVANGKIIEIWGTGDTYSFMQ